MDDLVLSAAVWKGPPLMMADLIKSSMNESGYRQSERVCVLTVRGSWYHASVIDRV